MSRITSATDEIGLIVCALVWMLIICGGQPPGRVWSQSPEAVSQPLNLVLKNSRKNPTFRQVHTGPTKLPGSVWLVGSNISFGWSNMAVSHFWHERLQMLACWRWRRAPVEGTTRAGSMTRLLGAANSFLMVVAREMTTTSSLKMSACRGASEADPKVRFCPLRHLFVCRSQCC